MTNTTLSPLVPTFHGYLATTMDALILFEAGLSGHLSHIPRRPQDRERPSLIRSGNIFIYEEHSSGIKRWTDGVAWSPSRILQNFLLYRELEKPFSPGEKKRAMKRPAKTDGVSKSLTRAKMNPPSPFRTAALIATANGLVSGSGMTVHNPSDADRPYIGSLIDSYVFKENGLIKKTISISYQGVTHHMVSYYRLNDVKSGALRRVKFAPELAHIVPRKALLAASNFRSPVDDDSEVNPADPPPYFYGSQHFNVLQHSGPRPALMPPEPYHQTNTYNTSPHYSGYGLDGAIPHTMSQPSTNTFTNSQQFYPGEPTFGTPPHSYSGMVPGAQGAPYDILGSNPATSHAGYSNATTSHSVYPSVTSQVGYPTLQSHAGFSRNTTAFLNGGGMTAMTSTFIHGDTFHSSGHDSAADGAPAGSSSSYPTEGISGLNQNSASHDFDASAHRRADGQLSNGFDGGMGRLSEHEYGATLHEHEGQHYRPVSSNASAPNYGMGTNSTQISSPDHDWESFSKREPPPSNY